MYKKNLLKILALAACLFLNSSQQVFAEYVFPADKLQYQLSEKVPNEALRQLLKDYYAIPEQDLQHSYYFYNYTDLNNDGQKEIFAVIAGPYTSGSGGNSAVIAEQGQDGWQVKQSFTLVRTPVIISVKEHNGYQDLIFYYSGGGAQGNYNAVIYQKGKYQNVSEGTPAEKFSGRAIIADDIDLYRNYGFDLAPAASHYTLKHHQIGKVHYPEMTDHKGVLTSEYANYSLRQTAFKMLTDDTVSVDYYVICNDGQMLSVIYEALQKDGSKVLTALNMEMKRAEEIKMDNAFIDLKALSGVLNISEKILAAAQFYVDGENFVFLYPSVKADTAGYEMVKRPYGVIMPFLSPETRRHFTAQ